MINRAISELKERIFRKESINKVDILSIVEAPLSELTTAANEIRQHFCGQNFDLCSIINVKSGRCSENCKFCAQAACYKTPIDTYPFLDDEPVLKQAMHDDQQGVLRFSMVAAAKKLNKVDIAKACQITRKILDTTKLSVCVSGGLLNEADLQELKSAGVDRIHNNLETSERFFQQMCSTHTFQDKIATLKAARRAGLSLCSGGVFGLGESMEDRVDLFFQLKELEVKSVPINLLNPIPGTPYENNKILTNDELCRIVAIARFILPDAAIRMAGGRGLLPDKGKQCFLSGANAAITGDMLTTPGITVEQDVKMITELGFKIRKLGE